MWATVHPSPTGTRLRTFPIAELSGPIRCRSLGLEVQRDRVPRCHCRQSRLNRQRVRMVAEAAAAAAVLERESEREVLTGQSQPSCNTDKEVLYVEDLRVE